MQSPKATLSDSPLVKPDISDELEFANHDQKQLALEFLLTISEKSNEAQTMRTKLQKLQNFDTSHHKSSYLLRAQRSKMFHSNFSDAKEDLEAHSKQNITSSASGIQKSIINEDIVDSKAINKTYESLAIGPFNNASTKESTQNSTTEHENQDRTEKSDMSKDEATKFGGKLSYFKNSDKNLEQKKKKTSEIKNVLHEVYIHKKRELILCFKLSFFVIFPIALLTSYLLFHLCGNPMAFQNAGSVSWWILFIGIRQVCTLFLARIVEALIIDIFTFRTKVTMTMFGPYFSLWLILARGWTFILPSWAIIDILLYGLPWFRNHALSWLTHIGMFSLENPSGLQIEAVRTLYSKILLSAVFAGMLTTLKRLYLFIHFGKTTHVHYGVELAKVTKKMMLLSEIGLLSNEIKRSDELKWIDIENVRNSLNAWEENANIAPRNRMSFGTQGTWDENFQVNPKLSPAKMPSLGSIPSSIHLSTAAQLDMKDLSGTWDDSDPNCNLPKLHKATIKDLLEFQQSLSLMRSEYPFSGAFGRAKTRKECLDSAQRIYDDLLLYTPRADILPFETICLVALGENGNIEEQKMKSLLKLFRPDKMGNVSRVNFMKSCDKVYKRMRILHSAIKNRGNIDHAAQNVFNIVYYFLLAVLVLQLCGFNPMTLLISSVAIFVSLTFVVKESASMYFEGLLFILVRRPYDIGDRINIAGEIDHKIDLGGSSTWFVENVTLFTTTVRAGSTNEVATYANGSLSRARIINWRRSPNATINIYFKITADASKEKIEKFHAGVKEYIEERPYEWVKLSAFRLVKVEPNLNFVEYHIEASLVEKWQNSRSVLKSKSDLMRFCCDLSKELKMEYSMLTVPVDLQVKENKFGKFEEKESGNEEIV